MAVRSGLKQQTCALDLVREADDGRLGDGRAGHKRTLHFGRTQPMPRHIDHIIHAPRDPNVVVLMTKFEDADVK